MTHHLHDRRVAQVPRLLPVTLLAACIGVMPLDSANAAPTSALDWRAGDGFRFAELAVPASGRAGFSSMPAATTGIHFTNLLTIERGLTNQIFMSGSGVACGDIDGDGWSDLYLCSLDSTNRLYRNRGGWRFEDISPQAGVGCPEGASTGAVFADVDADGDLDLLVSGIGRGVRLFQNQGAGRFNERTDEAGLRNSAASMSMALADVEGDGDLDLYVANYRSGTFQDQPAVRFRVATTNGVRRITMIEGRPPTAADSIRYTVSATGNRIVENGEADALYLNDGQGRFRAVSWVDGAFLDEDAQRLAAPPYDWGYSAMFRDINHDGHPDLYVCNDNESPDRCWINDGSGRFRALGTAALRQTSLSSMGVDFADLNRDGRDEFFVADMLSRDHGTRHRQMIDRHGPHPIGVGGDRPAYQRNTLFLNRGDGTYAEIAQLAGVDATDWSWTPVFLDVDLDGFEDLLVTTGLERSLRDADARRFIDREKAERRLSVREFQDLRRIMPRLDTPNHAYRNRGDLTFEHSSTAWGFDSRLNCQGMALADLDNDGDLDAVINVLNGPALLYRNESSAPRLAVRLRGRGANSRGIGARIRVLGAAVPQTQEMVSGGRYLSSDDPVRTFAAGHPTNLLTIEATWRSGRTSRLTGARANRVYELDEAKSEIRLQRPASPQSLQAPWFSDAGLRLNHRHHEIPFNDFERQTLLPRQLSRQGPGVCWGDFNRDGHEDLVIGTGRGGLVGVYLNDGRGGFNPLEVADVIKPAAGDTSTVLAAPFGSGATLLIGVSNYETGGTNDPSVVQCAIGQLGVAAGKSLPGMPSSVGPMAMADVDGDGYLDLFVGGAMVPGRYPELATSRLFRGTGEGFQLDRTHQSIFDGVGLVNGAVFSDLEGDGRPELVLACDWGPVRVFRNRAGRLEPWNAQLREGNGLTRSLAEMTGWWNSVTAGDFDGDGRMDLVAGNWGRNTRYQAHLHHPLRVYFGDPRGDGRVELLESHFEPTLGRYVPRRFWDTLSGVFPTLPARLPNATAYSRAGVDEVLGDLKTSWRQREVTTLDSILLLNRGEHFEARALPLESQLAPVFGLCVGDFDGDGHEDIFAAQNFFAVDSETSRHDAGRALWMQGDGRGHFEAITAVRSGIDVRGEGRGAALADIDSDGRLDLVVTQNGGATRLFRNEQGKPGLRVRVNAGLQNPGGIGAILRLTSGGKAGPSREVHAGSGYWSQDSLVQVLSPAGADATLFVRWPNGTSVTVAIPPGAKEVQVEAPGKISRLR